MSHYGYVIANTEDQADQIVRRYILATPGDRRVMEGWDISIKGGEHDAYELYRQHEPFEPEAKMWRVALALLPIDVPRETS